MRNQENEARVADLLVELLQGVLAESSGDDADPRYERKLEDHDCQPYEAAGQGEAQRKSSPPAGRKDGGDQQWQQDKKPIDREPNRALYLRAHGEPYSMRLASKIGSNN